MASLNVNKCQFRLPYYIKLLLVADKTQSAHITKPRVVRCFRDALQLIVPHLALHLPSFNFGTFYSTNPTVLRKV